MSSNSPQDDSPSSPSFIEDSQNAGETQIDTTLELDDSKNISRNTVDVSDTSICKDTSGEVGALLIETSFTSDVASPSTSVLKRKADNNKEIIEEKRKKRDSIEFLYSSNDSQEKSKSLPPVQEQEESESINLHFSPTQDIGIPLKETSPIIAKASQQSSSSSNSSTSEIFKNVKKAKISSSPSDLSQKSSSDSSQKHLSDLSIKSSDSPIFDSPPSKKKEEKKENDIETGFIFTKIEYRKNEDGSLMEDVKILWQAPVLPTKSENILSSKTSSPGFTSDEKPIQYKVDKKTVKCARYSVVTASSSSSGNMPPPVAITSKLPADAYKYLMKPIRLEKDPKFSAEGLLQLYTPPGVSPEKKINNIKESKIEVDTEETNNESNKKLINTPSTSTRRRKLSLSLSKSKIKTDDSKKVFAKWTDGKYYPGYVSDAFNGKWHVEFCDGNIKDLIDDYVIFIECLPIGQPIHAVIDDDDDYAPGIITELSKDKDGETIYTVDITDKGTSTVTRSKLCLDHEQFNILYKENPALSLTSPSPSSKLSLDNIYAEDKRRRGRSATSVTDSPRTSRMRSNRAGPSGNVRETYYTTSDAGDTFLWKDEWNKIHGVEKSTWPVIPATEGKTSKGKEKLLGPIPAKKIFDGYTFCLVYCDGEELDYASEAMSERESDIESQTETANNQPSFDRIYLDGQLRKGGGTVVNFFEYQNVKKRLDKCLIITNKCNLAAKTILSMAYGIKSVRFTWVIECCKQNKLIPPASFYLPIGFTQNRKRIDWFKRPKTPKPFINDSIAVVSSEKDVLDFWRQVLIEAKVHKVSVFSFDEFTEEEMKHNFTIIVTDQLDNNDLLNLTKELKKPLVTTTWIVQSLIHGKRENPNDYQLKLNPTSTKSLTEVIRDVSSKWK